MTGNRAVRGGVLGHGCFAILPTLVGAVYLVTAGVGAILDDGDALYAHVARQMLERDDWVTPYANGVRFLDKPPMMYWLMAASYAAIGTSELAARLPSVLAVLGTSGLLWVLGNRVGGTAAGLAAGAAFSCCVGTILFTRMVFPDILFVFFLTLALGAFLEWYSAERGALLPALVFYAALAGAVLTKGLIGLFFPVAIVVGFTVASGTWRRLGRFHPATGILVFSLLAVPWHLMAAWRNPGFTWYFFVNEQFLRFLGRRQPADYESIPLPIFWGLVLLWLFPWSAFLPALRHLAAPSRYRTGQAGAIVGVCLSWAIVVLLFFSVSSRIEHYALPLLPPLALLVGVALFPGGLGEAPEARHRRSIARGFGFLAALGAILGLGAVAGAFWLGSWGTGAWPGEAPSHPLGAYKFYFAPLLDLPPRTLARLGAPALGAAAVFASGLVLAWWLDRGGRRSGPVLVLSTMMMVFSGFAQWSLGICQERLSSRQFGRALAAHCRAGDRAIVVGDFETANSLNFYAPLEIDVYRGTAAVLEWGLRYPDAPVRILSREAVAARWSGPGREFVLAPEALLSELGIEGYSVVLRSSGRALVCNRPL